MESGLAQARLHRNFSSLARHLDAHRVNSLTQQLFLALDGRRNGGVSSKLLLRMLERQGLQRDDPRLASLFEELSAVEGDALANDISLNVQDFALVLSSCASLVHSAVTSQLRVPDMETVSHVLQEVYEKVLPEEGGANADYIPELEKVDPNHFAISFCSVDGQRASVGDTSKHFCIQSCSKPINYLIALSNFGDEYVHNCIGKEPSGVRFNQMVLKDMPTKANPNRAVPHNPLINSGAIVSSSMVFPEIENLDERREKVMDVWRQLSGGDCSPIGFCHETYRSESATADRNWCLGYMMKERGAFPPCFTSLGATLEAYFQVCSLLSTCDAMSVAAATLANGGLCPLTGVRVFESEHVRRVLPIMLTCGMYDYSGEWAYEVGLPAKSGVGGCIFMVIPNVGGIAVWSPRLDSNGNSMRGVMVAKELVRRLAIHNFEVFSGLSRTKIVLTMQRYEEDQGQITSILFAASQGDVSALMSFANSGADLFAADYDARTALHLAVAENHVNVVCYLVQLAQGHLAKLSAKDRWGGTPLGDAVRGRRKACEELLRRAGAEEDDCTSRMAAPSLDAGAAHMEKSAGLTLMAAACGDVEELIVYSARGVNLFACDYDKRTALHVAASNGHLPVIKYLLSQASGETKALLLKRRDRFGFTALDDARRENHRACVRALTQGKKYPTLLCRAETWNAAATKCDSPASPEILDVITFKCDAQSPQTCDTAMEERDAQTAEISNLVQMFESVEN
eukprot:TRINITY_DN38316_c0_g1_i1.p1 TRINITY_DN38316_c0_g1~~TRINITY_DN38316_c0_g1_i1.p1  ORF type:complete len:764 (+),score=151.77 TRINITY_DN38316_c0_g1_i1:71-2293(+)